MFNGVVSEAEGIVRMVCTRHCICVFFSSQTFFSCFVSTTLFPRYIFHSTKFYSPAFCHVAEIDLFMFRWNLIGTSIPDVSMILNLNNCNNKINWRIQWNTESENECTKNCKFNLQGWNFDQSFLWLRIELRFNWDISARFLTWVTAFNYSLTIIKWLFRVFYGLCSLWLTSRKKIVFAFFFFVFCSVFIVSSLLKLFARFISKMKHFLLSVWST